LGRDGNYALANTTISEPVASHTVDVTDFAPAPSTNEDAPLTVVHSTGSLYHAVSPSTGTITKTETTTFTYTLGAGPTASVTSKEIETMLTEYFVTVSVSISATAEYM